jgi:hypothetical protein
MKVKKHQKNYFVQSSKSKMPFVEYSKEDFGILRFFTKIEDGMKYLKFWQNKNVEDIDISSVEENKLLFTVKKQTEMFFEYDGVLLLAQNCFYKNNEIFVERDILLPNALN